jgi:hypothetical protein
MSFIVPQIAKFASHSGDSTSNLDIAFVCNVTAIENKGLRCSSPLFLVAVARGRSMVNRLCHRYRYKKTGRRKPCTALSNLANERITEM